MKSRLTLLVAVAIFLASCNQAKQLSKSTSNEVVLNQENVPLNIVLENIISEEFPTVENAINTENDFPNYSEIADSALFTWKIENDLGFKYQINPTNNPNFIVPNHDDYYLFYDNGTNGAYYLKNKPIKMWYGDFKWNKNTSPGWYKYFYKKQYYLGKKHLIFSLNNRKPLICYAPSYAYDNYRDYITRNYGRMNRYYHQKPTLHKTKIESVDDKGNKTWYFRNWYNGYTGTYGYTGYEFEFKTFVDTKKVKRNKPREISSISISDQSNITPQDSDYINMKNASKRNQNKDTSVKTYRFNTNGMVSERNKTGTKFKESISQNRVRNKKNYASNDLTGSISKNNLIHDSKSINSAITNK